MKKKITTLIITVLVFALTGCSTSKSEAGNTSSANINLDTVDFTVGMNPNRDYLIIVNDKNEYIFGSDYDKALQSDIIWVTDNGGIPTPIEKGTNCAFTMLKNYLKEQKGIEIELYNGFRTKEDQQQAYDYYDSLRDWAISPPGFSEHHTGLLLSIVIKWEIDGELVWMLETPERSNAYPDLKVVHDALAKFGFIDRYPEGKEELTGVPYEPYEIRFVGSTKIAYEIMDNNLCLEEYLQNRNN